MKTQSFDATDYGSFRGPESERSKPVDGIVLGLDRADAPANPRSWVRDTWIFSVGPDETVVDFFLDNLTGATDTEADPSAWICRGVRKDGSIILGRVNLHDDRFLSEIFSPTAER